MTNKIKRLISILLVTVLFLLTIQPAFATGNKRKIDDYSIEELLNLSCLLYTSDAADEL